MVQVLGGEVADLELAGQGIDLGIARLRAIDPQERLRGLDRLRELIGLDVLVSVPSFRYNPARSTGPA
jgi:hypothetical protein